MKRLYYRPTVLTISFLAHHYVVSRHKTLEDIGQACHFPFKTTVNTVTTTKTKEKTINYVRLRGQT